MMEIAEADALAWARAQDMARRAQLYESFYWAAPAGWLIGRTADRLLPRDEPREPWVLRAVAATEAREAREAAAKAAR